MANNKYTTCPPRMSDGRHFTDYTPRCGIRLNELASKQPLNSYELRQYLIHHADEIMATNLQAAVERNACGPCVAPWNKGTMLPESSFVECNKNTCRVVAGTPEGLGQGRVYEEAPQQQQAYISRMMATDQKFNVPPAQESMYPDMYFGRTAMPSGASLM
jgi:hypothetical protein